MIERVARTIARADFRAEAFSDLAHVLAEVCLVRESYRLIALACGVGR